MVYVKQNWEDLPAKTTPLSAARLEQMETQYDEAVAELQPQIDEKAPSDSPTFTGTVSGVTKAHVGLGNADNTSDANIPGFPRGTVGTKYRMVACTLRRVNSTTWEFLNDSGHTPTGVASVSITSTYVRLTYNFTATKVVTGIATPDESFAAVAGMRIGASVGLTFMDIYTYIGTNTAPSDPGALSTAGANIWVYGVFEVA